jgi:prophage tail gpP-like protein
MSLNSVDTDVRVILNGEEIKICEQYQVKIAMLTQPSEFTATFGHSKLAVDLFKRFPARTPFELQIAKTTQFTGKTDGWSFNGDPNGGTQLQLKGRDKLAPLIDTFVRAEQTFKDVSIAELCRKVFDIVYGAGNYKLVASNAANRSAMSNTKGKKTSKTAVGLGAKSKGGGGSSQADVAKQKATLHAAAPDVDLAVLLDSGPNVQKKPIQAKVGMRWYGDILKPQLDRAGLFLWSAVDGTFFIVSGLQKSQSPIVRIRHRRGSVDNVVEKVSFQHDTSQRYSRCEVWGRRGGGAESRSKVSGLFVDDEMTALGYDRPLVISDEKSSTPQQAEFLARMKIGESRRNGWQLSYTIAGHTLPLITDPSVNAVIIPDTVVDVDDQELGIDGPHYIESVEHSGQPHMTTTIRLMRPSDLVFGDATGGA